MFYKISICESDVNTNIIKDVPTRPHLIFSTAEKLLNTSPREHILPYWDGTWAHRLERKWIDLEMEEYEPNNATEMTGRKRCLLVLENSSSVDENNEWGTSWVLKPCSFYVYPRALWKEIGVLLNEDECIIAVMSENKKGELKRQTKAVSK